MTKIETKVTFGKLYTDKSSGFKGVAVAISKWQFGCIRVALQPKVGKDGKKPEADVVMSCDFDILSKITDGKLTVQRAFMTGDIKAKGNFTLLYKLDQLFAF